MRFSEPPHANLPCPGVGDSKEASSRSSEEGSCEYSEFVGLFVYKGGQMWLKITRLKMRTIE